ncbi:DUF5794 domain-containing protein [Halosolutus amylolyticus]|uniref:DUF5794 domain-containing protein n=1 Tax=Halosolutus amylolyticus TaxID=2932267 RepID=A0ABD5PNA0_9EURY|nr:DUF5794 domain-containing protein [Halosolutus amylolyticus]
MSTSQHPVALRLERIVGGNARLLALVMMLPLIDGVFPALILAGAVDDPLGAIQVGLLIFGGSATVAVILAEMTGTPREQAAVVLLVGIPLILLAAVQAALAPAIESVLDIVIFERFAALVIAAIAAKTASATIGEYLPNPGVIIALGLVASLDPNGAQVVVMDDPALVANATLAAVVGVIFALTIALAGPYLREYMDIDRFRFGSAVALGLLPLSLLGMAFGQAPLAALLVAAVFAIDIQLDRSGEDDTGAASIVADGSSTADATGMPIQTMGTAPAVGTGPLPDGGSGGTDRDADERSGDDSAAADADDADDSTYPGDDSTDTEGRAPWL